MAATYAAAVLHDSLLSIAQSPAHGGNSIPPDRKVLGSKRHSIWSRGAEQILIETVHISQGVHVVRLQGQDIEKRVYDPLGAFLLRLLQAALGHIGNRDQVASRCIRRIDLARFAK
jgi:hypothetical protein